MIGPQLLANGVVEGLNIGLLGVSFWLVFRSTRVFHISSAAVYTLAPFVLWSASRSGVPWPLGVAAAVAAGALLSVGCEAVNHGRLDRVQASPDLHLVASLGTYVVVTQAVAIFWGNEAKFLHPGAHPRVALFGIILTRAQILVAAVSCTVLAAVGAWLHRTSLGLRVRYAGFGSYPGPRERVSTWTPRRPTPRKSPDLCFTFGRLDRLPLTA